MRTCFVARVPMGKNGLSGKPCATGAQKALDDRDHRQRKRLVQEQKAEADRKKPTGSGLEETMGRVPSR